MKTDGVPARRLLPISRLTAGQPRDEQNARRTARDKQRGEKEMSERKVSVRRQGKGDLGARPVEEFLTEIVSEIKERKAE